VGACEALDLRGADLSRALMMHPHPGSADAEELAGEATDVRGARYDDQTQWPKLFDVEAAGAVRT
jgi:hypothetical protein